MKPALWLTTLLCLGAWVPAFGQSLTTPKEWAERQLSHEMADCAAFYVLCAEYQRRRGDIENAKTTAMLASFLLDRAVTLEDESVVMAQAKATMSRLRAEVRADPDSIHELVDRHGPACWDSWKDREARLSYWLEHWHFGP
jgi:hypothetical protein